MPRHWPAHESADQIFWVINRREPAEQKLFQRIFAASLEEVCAAHNANEEFCDANLWPKR